MHYRNFMFMTLLIVLAGAGCATTPKETAYADPADNIGPMPMVAIEGYRGDGTFFIKYRLGDRVLYSGGDWSDRLQLVDGPAPTNYATPSLVPMQYHRETPWESLPPDAVEIPIFAIEEWRLLRDRLLRSEVPGDGTGLVVDFGDAEYFLFYDRNGQFQATRFLDKPPDYSVSERLHFVEFMRRGRPILEAFLRDRGITRTEFAFNTGDTGPYSLPFLYINTERRLLVFVRNVPLVPQAAKRVPGMEKGQAFGHMLQSHLVNLVQRPVSSVSRLFFVVSDTAATTVTFDWATALSRQPVPEVAEAAPMDLEKWETELDSIANRPRSSGSVDILVGGHDYFTRLIDAVSAARQSVHLQTYIFDNDDFAIKIGELLKRRSNEGIEVKVLLDGLGTITSTMTQPESMPERHLPPASVRRFLEKDSQVKVRQKANPWFTGDHVKSTIIDHEVAFIGGMNIGREYRYDWHDLMMEISGPVVDIIDREFQVAWSHAGPLGDLGYLASKARSGQAGKEDVTAPLRVLLTGPGNYEIYSAQLKAIRRAQQYIYIQNAYFTDDTLLRELVLARRRGVDVRVVIPLKTDHGPVNRSNVLAINLMLQHGIRVYLYPGFSHVKAAIYDGWVCAGSANFDRLSLHVNRELNIASSDPGIAAQFLERIFYRDFGSSPELTEQIPDRWMDHIVEIVGDYLF